MGRTHFAVNSRKIVFDQSSRIKKIKTNKKKTYGM